MRIIGGSGQSNGAGAGFGGQPPVDPDVLIWHHTTQDFQPVDLSVALVTACGGVIGGGTKNNLVVARAHRLKEMTGEPVGIVIEPKGGTRLDQGWLDPGATVWPHLDAQLMAAHTATGLTLDEFDWHQGEAEVLVPATFESHWLALNQLHGKLRVRPYWRQNTRFIAGELIGRTSPANQAIQRLNEGEIPYAAAASSIGLTTEVDGHIDGPSLWDFGYNRYGSADVSLLARPGVIPITTGTIEGSNADPQVFGKVVSGFFKREPGLCHVRAAFRYNSRKGGAGYVRFVLPQIPVPRILGTVDYVSIGNKSNCFRSRPEAVSSVAHGSQAAFTVYANGGQLPVAALSTAGGEFSFSGTFLI